MKAVAKDGHGAIVIGGELLARSKVDADDQEIVFGCAGSIEESEFAHERIAIKDVFVADFFLRDLHLDDRVLSDRSSIVKDGRALFVSGCGEGISPGCAEITDEAIELD